MFKAEEIVLAVDILSALKIKQTNAIKCRAHFSSGLSGVEITSLLTVV
jgi:hypothetical protein